MGAKRDGGLKAEMRKKERRKEGTYLQTSHGVQSTASCCYDAIIVEREKTTFRLAKSCGGGVKAKIVGCITGIKTTCNVQNEKLELEKSQKRAKK